MWKSDFRYLVYDGYYGWYPSSSARGFNYPLHLLWWRLNLRCTSIKMEGEEISL